MHGLTTADLLTVWEVGLQQRPVERALALLKAADPHASLDELAHLSIGHRDALLLTLREQLFGGQLTSVLACPNCRERIELDFSTHDLRSLGQAVESEHRAADGLTLSLAGYELRFRLPTSADLEAIAREPNVNDPGRSLLALCILSATRDGEDVAAEQLPGDVTMAVADLMAQADPMADVSLSPCCPACNHRWLARFDIVAFLWAEIVAWAQHTVRDVHVLAAACGWREEDILAMSPFRRQIYLDLIGER